MRAIVGRAFQARSRGWKPLPQSRAMRERNTLCVVLLPISETNSAADRPSNTGATHYHRP